LEPFGSGFALRISAIEQAISADFPKRMLGERLLTVREPQFPVIKIRRHSRKDPFSGMFGTEVHHVRSKPRMEGDIKNFEGLSLESLQVCIDSGQMVQFRAGIRNTVSWACRGD
jgi:hypothetical protein